MALGLGRLLVNSSRKMELRVKRQIALTTVVSTAMGTVIARIPELDVWDHGSSEGEAVDGALSAAVGLFEIMEEEGRLDEFLAKHGFSKKQGVFKSDRESRRKILLDYTNSLRWEPDDPNKGIIHRFDGLLTQCKAVESFTLVQPSSVWERSYGQKAAVKLAS